MLELKKINNWETLEDIGDEVDIIEQFSEYGDGTYICDAITEIADRAIPIYNYNVWENAPAIKDYIEEAISNGIADTSSKDIDLINIFQSGYYEYYNQLLYTNLKGMVYNYAIDALNNRITELEGIEIDKDELIDYLELELDSIDNNNMFSDIDEVVDNLIKNFTNKEDEE